MVYRQPTKTMLQEIMDLANKAQGSMHIELSEKDLLIMRDEATEFFKDGFVKITQGVMPIQGTASKDVTHLSVGGKDIYISQSNL